MKKLWNKSCGNCKRNGVSDISWKMNNGVNFEHELKCWREGKKVMFIPHFMRIASTEPKWLYIYTHPRYKPWKDLFDLEWAETSVDWKIRANLWVKSCMCSSLLVWQFLLFQNYKLLNDCVWIWSPSLCEVIEYLCWAWTCIWSKFNELENFL